MQAISRQELEFVKQKQIKMGYLLSHTVAQLNKLFNIVDKNKLENDIGDSGLTEIVDGINTRLTELEVDRDEMQDQIVEIDQETEAWESGVKQMDPLYKRLTKDRQTYAIELDLEEGMIHEASVVKFKKTVMVGTIAGITGKFSIPTSWVELDWDKGVVEVLFTYRKSGTKASLILLED